MRLLRRRPRELDCIEFVELVTDYLEGALAEKDARALEHHLTICGGCLAYLEQMRKTVRIAGHLGIDDIPPDGVDELLEAFRAYKAERADE